MKSLNLMRLLAVAFALFCASLVSSHAQTPWPSKPIKLIVPAPAGGNNDNLARVLADRMRDLLNTPVIIENKPGATGQLATAFTLQSEPDGYTLIVAASQSFTVLPNLRKVPYDHVNGFETMGGVADPYTVMAVRTGLGVSTLAEFIQLAKANPGKLTYGSAGIAAYGHVAGESLRRATGINILHVPFKGSAEAAAALAGGQIDMQFDGTNVPLAKAGRAVPIAVYGRVRHPELPAIPTLAEAGAAVQLPRAPAWGLFAPKGTPQPILQRLSRTLEQILAEPATREKLSNVSTPAFWQSPADYRKSLATDLEFYREFLPAIGIKPE